MMFKIIFGFTMVNKLKPLFFRVLLQVGRNQWRCGLRPLAGGIAGSNPAGDMDACLL